MSIINGQIINYPGLICRLFLAVSLADLALMGWDKYQAQRGGRRIRESVLLGLGVLGGGLGLWLGMTLFHHKISKAKFRYSAPFLAMFQWGAILYFGGLLCLQ
ncbi:MAG: DUF1294 domain-containing protein [Peptococcaceae bacterium]|nr:DUF1294 domain-containing protein [Peptococcaceae bacterium]